MALTVTFTYRTYSTYVEHIPNCGCPECIEGRKDKIERRVHAYAAATPADAIFHAYHQEGSAALDHSTHVRCEDEPEGPEPESLLMNWQRDPMNEVSEGYLSNMAHAFTNTKRRLEHTPRYCTEAHYRYDCPECGDVLPVFEGRYGDYFRCVCGFKTGVKTKKAKRVPRVVTDVCGERMVAMLNHMGVSYEGCPACSGGDYSKRPIREIIGSVD